MIESRNIFNLDNDTRHLQQILESMVETDQELTENGGELTPALESIAAQDEHALVRKIDGYGAVVHNYDTKLAAIDAETKRLATLKKFYSRARTGLLNLLEFQMKRFGITELQGEITRVNFRKSSFLQVDEDAVLKPYLPLLYEMQKSLPPYMTIQVSIDKKLTGTALDNEEPFPEGAVARGTRYNIQIK